MYVCIYLDDSSIFLSRSLSVFLSLASLPHPLYLRLFLYFRPISWSLLSPIWSLFLPSLFLSQSFTLYFSFIYIYIYIYIYISFHLIVWRLAYVVTLHSGSVDFGLIWFGLILWHINHCRLFNAESIFIRMNSSISNNLILAWVRFSKVSYQDLDRSKIELVDIKCLSYKIKHTHWHTHTHTHTITHMCKHTHTHTHTYKYIIIIMSWWWCNCYRRRNWTRGLEFISWTRLIAFHIALIPLERYESNYSPSSYG